jgi:hypothetical protein
LRNLLYKVSPRDPIAFGAAFYFDRRRARRLFSPGPPRHPHRSRPRPADLSSSQARLNKLPQPRKR